MLSVRETARVAAALDAALRDGFVDKIVQRDECTVELTCERARRDAPGRERTHLRLSVDPELGYAGTVARFEPAPPVPGTFAQLLRARVGRARIAGAEAAAGERRIALRLARREGVATLLLALQGPRSNLYLLDVGGRLEGALRPLAATRPELAVGEPWSPPATAPPPEGDDRFREVPDEALLATVGAHHARAAEERAAESLARTLGRALEREARRLARRESALRGDLDAAGDADAHRRLGELLKTALHGVRRGDAEAVVRDPASGEPVRIPLDPALAPSENLERLFAAHRRARRREAAVATQLAALEEERSQIAPLRSELAALTATSATPPREALERLAAAPMLRRLLARGGARAGSAGPGARRSDARRPAAGKGTPLRLQPARYRTSDGLEVWVGRNAPGNDHLTTRLARGNDLFVHAEDGPGSHVVLKTQGRRDVPERSLLEAAELALHFSKQRHAGRGAVRVAAIGDVRKPRGAKPGLVVIQRGRSLALRRDEARLRGILSRRLDGES